MTHSYRFSFYAEDDAHQANVPDLFIFDDFGSLHLVTDDQLDSAIYYFTR